jgi:hypothetical protein
MPADIAGLTSPERICRSSSCPLGLLSIYQRFALRFGRVVARVAGRLSPS